MRLSHLAVVGLVTLVSTLTAGSATAAAQCKGLAQDRCAAQNGCSWVDPYTRKDGIKVSGHCRTRPGDKADRGIDMQSRQSGKTG